LGNLQNNKSHFLSLIKINRLLIIVVPTPLNDLEGHFSWLHPFNSHTLWNSTNLIARGAFRLR